MTTPTVSPLTPLPPVTRDGAAAQARRELERPEYHRDDPSLIQRLENWVEHQLDRLLGHAIHATPGGAWGLVVLLALLVLLGVALRVRLGRLPRPDLFGDLTGGPGAVSPAQLRARADESARDGRFADAVLQRTRAVVRDLQDRGLVDRRPGRTLPAVVAVANTRLPAAQADLAIVVQIFDATWYGGRPADAAVYARLVEADATISGTRAVVRV